MRVLTKTKEILWGVLKFLLAVVLLAVSGVFIWVATFDLPDVQSFENRQVQQSTKIYDQTGEHVLYNLNRDVRRTTVPLADISENLQAATLAIEDSGFYDHLGIKPSAILRAAWTNLQAGSFKQGGSTITQQVVKNTLLTPKKTITRKIKEWILAIRLDQKLAKEEILEIYLNEVPYGGRVYGAEEAAERYFGTSAENLSIAESAYLAALPKAPTYFSPYGNNRDKLDQRQNEVLKEMHDNGLISKQRYKNAKQAEITFAEENVQSLQAPHFVFHIKKKLEKEYGTTAIERRGLRVITTLDNKLQKQAQNVLQEYGQKNAQKYNANNSALVAVDPNSGKIRAMVGSRDYGNDKIEGSFNAATALRQPGSAFKPFAYATALNKGYTDDTVVFDLPTQFSNICPPSEFENKENCFSPINYDGKFRGPITLRNALAQSVNVPSVKTLYLAGMKDSLDTAQRMGVDTLDAQPNKYGLSLVLGSGEVTLLDITSAYGVFANEGVKNQHVGINRVEDASGSILEEFEKNPQRVLPKNTAREITDILSDNQARAPAFGQNSPLHFPNYDVAVKTGTTNNYRDLWTVGYSPNLAVGVWSGNNDNTPVAGEVAGFVVAPMWNAFMKKALAKIDNNSFRQPNQAPEDLKPILRGVWQGGSINISNSTSSVPVRRRFDGVHNILHWVNKNNPRGPVPVTPESDPQYDQWEYSVQQWVNDKQFADDAGGDITNSGSATVPNTDTDTSSFLIITSDLQSDYDENDDLIVSAKNTDGLDDMEIHINSTLVDEDNSQPFNKRLEVDEIDAVKPAGRNRLKIRGISNNGRVREVTKTFTVSDN